MKKLKYINLYESFQSLHDDDSNEFKEKIKLAKNLDEINSIITDSHLSKGELMKIAYNGNTRNVDSALPIQIWNYLKPYGGTSMFVMDYQTNHFGEIVHLGEKINGKQSNWSDIINNH